LAAVQLAGPDRAALRTFLSQPGVDPVQLGHVLTVDPKAKPALTQILNAIYPKPRNFEEAEFVREVYTDVNAKHDSDVWHKAAQMIKFALVMFDPGLLNERRSARLDTLLKENAGKMISLDLVGRGNLLNRLIEQSKE
jgi:hypothetical protein